jgi:hypothetical protein
MDKWQARFVCKDQALPIVTGFAMVSNFRRYIIFDLLDFNKCCQASLDNVLDCYFLSVPFVFDKGSCHLSSIPPRENLRGILVLSCVFHLFYIITMYSHAEATRLVFIYVFWSSVSRALFVADGVTVTTSFVIVVVDAVVAVATLFATGILAVLPLLVDSSASPIFRFLDSQLRSLVPKRYGEKLSMTF